MNPRPQPGDRIQVVDGTFVGMQGVVVDPAEAQAIWQRIGGQEPPRKPDPRIVFVILPIFDRDTLVCLEHFQVERLTQ